MINQMIDDLKEAYAPFVKQTYEIITLLLVKETTDTIKNESAKIMGKLIKVISILEKPQYAKQFLAKLWLLL
jgi:hypothetical protein